MSDILAARHVRTAGLIIFCAGATLAASMGIRQAFGLFLTPISQDLGLGREVFALAMGLLNLTWGLAAPFAGAVADKYGASRVVIVGAMAYAAGLLLMATSSGPNGLIWAGMLVGLGVSGTGFTAVLGAVGRSVPEERRGSALGLASMGGSIGQFAALPYAHLLISDLGWSVSLVVLAGTAALMAPLAWGLAGQAVKPTDDSDQSLGDAFSEAIRHPGFLLLTAGFFVCGFHIAFVAVHLPSYLADKAFEPWVGAAALTAVGLANIIGTYACGRIGELIEKRLALSLLYLARSAVFLAFLVLPLTETVVLAFGFLLGLLWLGTVPLTSGLVATLFGPRWMSMLFGIVFLSHQIGSFLGAWLGGYLYDIFQSYDAMWYLSIVLGLMAAGLNWPIRERPVERLRSRRAAIAE